MVSKVENTRQEETFDFVLDHADIVDMMNDPQVLLDDGTVDDAQTFEVLLRKSNGAEVKLKDMEETDALIFRFKKVTIDNQETDLNGVDVT